MQKLSSNLYKIITGVERIELQGNFDFSSIYAGFKASICVTLCYFFVTFKYHLLPFQSDLSYFFQTYYCDNKTS